MAAAPYHHGDLRPALIVAARRLLRSQPSDPELSVRAVSRAVGVSANAPYRHFANREHLLEAVAASGYRDLSRSLDRSATGGAVAVASTWERLVEREPVLAGLMTTLTPRSEELGEAIADWLGTIANAISHQDPQADPGWVLQRSVDCWAAVHGLTELRRHGMLASLDDWMISSPELLAGRVVTAPDKLSDDGGDG